MEQSQEQVRVRRGHSLQSDEPSADKKISLALLEAFSTPAGIEALNYLRASFTNTVVNPGTASDRDLWFREGQRSVVGIIDQRMREAVQ